jgi:hypothetical protein
MGDIRRDMDLGKGRCALNLAMKPSRISGAHSIRSDLVPFLFLITVVLFGRRDGPVSRAAPGIGQSCWTVLLPELYPTAPRQGSR